MFLAARLALILFMVFCAEFIMRFCKQPISADVFSSTQPCLCFRARGYTQLCSGYGLRVGCVFSRLRLLLSHSPFSASRSAVLASPWSSIASCRC